MSESQIDQHGMEITKQNGQLMIKNPKGKTIMEGHLRGNLYEIDSVIAPPTAHYDVAFSAHTPSNLNLWHAHIGYISLKSLRYLEHHQLVTGFNLCGNGKLAPCNGCAKGKHHQAPFPLAATN